MSKDRNKKYKDAAKLARQYHEICHKQRKAWQEDPDDNGRSELWLARAMGMSAFISWLGEDEEE